MSLEQFYALPELEQEDWIARHERDRETCKFHGGPVEECADDERDWFPQMSVCQPTMQLAAAQELYADLHEEMPFHDGTRERWAKKRSRMFPFHYRDGTSFWMSPVELDPDNDFLSDAPPDDES